MDQSPLFRSRLSVLGQPPSIRDRTLKRAPEGARTHQEVHVICVPPPPPNTLIWTIADLY